MLSKLRISLLYLLISSSLQSVLSNTALGIIVTFSLNSFPSVVNVIITLRSSSFERSLIIRPRSSSRFKTGVNVPESRYNSSPKPLTDIFSFSYKTRRTKYCD